MGQWQQFTQPAAEGAGLLGGLVQQALQQSSELRFPEVMTAAGGNGSVALHQLENLVIAQAACNQLRRGADVFTAGTAQQRGHTDHTAGFQFRQSAEATALLTEQPGIAAFDQENLTGDEAAFAERLAELVALCFPQLQKFGAQGTESV